MLLVVEMSVFMLLIVPLPYTWKRKLFNFISENPLIAKLQYGMKVCFFLSKHHPTEGEKNTS